MYYFSFSSFGNLCLCRNNAHEGTHMFNEINCSRDVKGSLFSEESNCRAFTVEGTEFIGHK
jgi:hypothetical protein